MSTPSLDRHSSGLSHERLHGNGPFAAVTCQVYGYLGLRSDVRLQVLRMPQVCKVTGLCRSMIYQLEAEKRFPSRIRLGLRASAGLRARCRSGWRSESSAAAAHSRILRNSLDPYAARVCTDDQASAGVAHCGASGISAPADLGEVRKPPDHREGIEPRITPLGKRSDTGSRERVRFCLPVRSCRRRHDRTGRQNRTLP